MRSDEYKEGWRDAMNEASLLLGQMVKWDHSSYGVYTTYETAFYDVACVLPPGSSHIAMFERWTEIRDE